MNPRLFCNVVYAFLVRNADDKQRKELDAELYAPVNGTDNLSVLLANVLEEDGTE